MPTVIRHLVALLGGVLFAAGACAQAFPGKPVKIVVNFAVGGPADLMARVFAEHLTARVGQPVIVEALPGANGNLGAQAVSRASADGHTLLLTAEALQAAFRRFRSSATGRGLAPTWSAVGLHRESEFNKTHVPAFIDGRPARRWVAVYPYLRSYEWYLLPDTERAALLGEHGKLGRDYPAVQNNTIAAFALNDYEWLLAVESDELDQIVDLMRHLRSSATRRHVRLETPFFTGRRIDAAGVAGVLA